MKSYRKTRFPFGAFIIILVVCVLTSALSGAGGAFLMFNLLYSTPEETTAQEFIIDEETEAQEAQTEQAAATEEAQENTAPPEQTTAETVTVYIPSTTAAPALSKGDIYSEAVHSTITIKTAWKQYYSSILGSYYRPVTSSGTGFCVSDNGYIVTNYHVIENAEEITVVDYNGNEYPATLVGGESANDFAVIKVDAKTVSAKMGSSSELQVGDDIMVIGNALGQLSYTFTDGIVSHLDRTISFDNGRIMNMFQTNAAINKGNSGGPVYNMNGEVVGIASAKINSENIEGLGFFIPIDDVKDMMYDIIIHGYVTGKPSLGVTVQTVTSIMSSRYSIPTGCYVVALDKDSSCYEAGMRTGDVITKLGSKTISQTDDVAAFLYEKSAGDKINITWYSQGETKTASIIIGEKKPSEPRTDYSNVYDY